MKVHIIYFDPNNLEILIEYLIKCEPGERSIKIIYSCNSMSTPQKYYEYERTK